MLDRARVAQKISHITPLLFTERTSLAWINKKFWQRLVEQPAFIAYVQTLSVEKQLISWMGALGQIVAHEPVVPSYTVYAVDGSQIYPDHHLEGVACCLVHAAGCRLHYGVSSSATFFSEPHVYVPALLEAQQLPFAADTVDMLREAHEFDLLARTACQGAQKDYTDPVVALFDGNLLFWHLEEKSALIRKMFLERYCASLQLLYEQRIPIAGYLSAPRFRDLAYLVQVGMTAEGVADWMEPAQRQVLEQKLASLTDVELLTHVLDAGEYTAIFQSNSALTEYYPTHLRPCFLYLHSGSEVVRVEIPWWVAQDPDLVKRVVTICCDQSRKGNGYPVALAESHAQAVVKSADRDFFYNYIGHVAITQRQRVFLSQKSLKKRVLGV
ncbi:MAG: DNA double-strand break repair nuclease NurA [Candidatus Babeliales bacterium]|jgi:hypothetical protein